MYFRFTHGSSSKSSQKRSLEDVNDNGLNEETPKKDEKLPRKEYMYLAEESCELIGSSVERNLRPYLKTLSSDSGKETVRGLKPLFKVSIDFHSHDIL